MHINWRHIATIAAFAAALGAPAAAAPPDMDEVPLTISGCVKAGEERDSFLLTNVVIDGTTLAPTNAFYRFNTTDGLEHYVGRRVEVKGTADLTDVDRGKLRVRSHDDGRVTTEIRSERRTVEVEDMWFGSFGAIKIDADVPTYKFDVDEVRPLQGNCASAVVVP